MAKAKSVKIPNYTEVEMANMRDMVTEGKTVDHIVELFQGRKNRRQVTAKLVNMGIYGGVTVAAPARKADLPTKKEILAALAEKGLNVEGLEGATVPALLRVSDKLESVAVVTEEAEPMAEAA